MGYEVERPDGQPTETLGLFRIPGEPTDPGGALGAMRYFENGGDVPLLAKAERRASVHRRVPLDLVVVPVKEGGKVTGIGVHAGLWTSEALSSPVEEVPLLRRRLQQLEREFGFDPSGHSGKALRHAVTALPHDLLVSLSVEAVRELVTTAMSLADRPRPTLVLVRSILKGNMFAFVWLPRDELTTRRRLAIGKMIEEASQGRISNWSVELGDGDLALIRYTLYVGPETPTPDVAELDRRLDEMVRGWEPSVEEALGELVGPQRATRLAMHLSRRFPGSATGSPSRRPRRLRTYCASARSTAPPSATPGSTARPTTGRSGSGSTPTGSPRSSRCPTRCRCSRISASGCSRSIRPRSTKAGSATSTNSCSRSAPARPPRCSTAPSWSSGRSPKCSRAGPRTTRSTSCSSPPRSPRATSSCSAPGSAICARAACLTRW